MSERYSPAQLRKLARIAADFQRSMDNLDRCPRCGKPRVTVSVRVGNDVEREVTSGRCACPSSDKERGT